jgi:hypothetical protein
MMALGWGFGHYLIRAIGKRNRSLVPVLLFSGFVGIAIFAIVRGLNGFGNMQLLRLDNTLIQWIHTSKYPPSISFIAMELGLMSLILAGLFTVQKFVGNRVNKKNPFLVFGQTPFFFYILHILLFELSARAIGIYQQSGLTTSWIATIIVLVVLYPVCLWYRTYKAAQRQSVLRFI